MSREISITTRKQLEIFMNVQRQKLLKTMDMEKVPMTPKQLSVILEISPSSVTYHLKKLEELGWWSWTIQKVFTAFRQSFIEEFRQW